MKPVMSEYFSTKEPSVIRSAQIEFSRRRDNVRAVNVAIGNVSLPMHPAMVERMKRLGGGDSPFGHGVVKYTETVGLQETRSAFLNIIASSGLSVDGLQVLVTEGGSQAMELVIVGVCGAPGSGERPLLVIDPAYTNYKAMAVRLGRGVISIARTLKEDGTFTLPGINEIERVIESGNPGALLVIPYDNPTGQLYDRDMLISLAGLCVKHNIWFVSDEAYRELYYAGRGVVSVWGLSNGDVPGIEGRRISIESASKVWNACGLRIGALVTDNEEFHRRAVAENTANLCPNAMGQYIFGALAHESSRDLTRWYEKQRSYYGNMLSSLNTEFKRLIPGVIISRPDAALYSVIDVRRIAASTFDAFDFVRYCASKGSVQLADGRYTLLVAPMAGFYNSGQELINPGRTQMRIAYVETPETMKYVPLLFKELFAGFARKVKKN